ncbi:MAG: nucleotidyltransferase domain-containing protein [Aeromicrobium sp.]|uniref:nucleotidyltransferase family protein n=1 Tax=Aeromicrobium sp. TaxID=1871063 RepID=UPI0039E3418C
MSSQAVQTRERVHPAHALAHHREAVKELVRQHQGTDVWVFGSVARGEATHDSDIDLLVDFTDDVTLHDEAVLHQRLEELLGVSVDLIGVEDVDEHGGSIARDAKWL